MRLNNPPKILDVFILSVFTILITAQPFFLHHEIIMLDTGNHLPAINALLHGKVLYKDFVYWRGPVDLYIPALMMKIWGPETALLSAYFYVGTVLTLLAAVWIAGQMYRTRFLLYLMVPVLIARTFPRVSYYYWGGFRYFIGFMALFCAIRGFKKKNPRWLFGAGMICAVCWFTTIEAGVSTILGITAAMGGAWGLKIFPRDFIKKSFLSFCAGGLLLALPYVGYLMATESFTGYIETTLTVPKFLTTLMDARGQYPENIWMILYSCIPGTRFFKFMTPLYIYMAFLGYLGYRIRKRKFDWEIPALIALAVYGVILFFASFRFIQGHHFEMALQPEKIIYFFLIERVFLLVRQRREGALTRNITGEPVTRRGTLAWPVIYGAVVVSLLGSSLGYSIARYTRRFPLAQMAVGKLSNKDMNAIKPLHNQETKTLNVKRVRHMTVPRWQAEEIEGVVTFLKENTKPQDKIFCYPEVGNFAFWADRPLVGRFAIGTSVWIDEQWYTELREDFLREQPEYVIMTHVGHRTFPAAIYFRYPKNIPKYNEMTELILGHYTPVKSFESVAIYRRNG